MWTDVSEEYIISETSVLIQTTRRCIPEDDNIHNYQRENLKSHEIVAIWQYFLNYIYIVAKFASQSKIYKCIWKESMLHLQNNIAIKFVIAAV
jgi:hypothetical protein